MHQFLRTFERVATQALVVMLAVVVAVSVVQVAWALGMGLLSPSVAHLDTERLLDVFGTFLLVLIGVELLETLNAYVHDHELRAEFIILVALIALARKLITVELGSQSAGTLLGLAALVASLALAYFLVRRTRERTRDERPSANRP